MISKRRTLDLQESLHSRVGRFAELVRRTLHHDGAIVKHYQDIRDPKGAGHIVGHDDARDIQFVLELKDQLVDGVGPQRVQPGGGLVVQDDFGTKNDRPRQGHAFALPAGELCRHPVDGLSHAHHVQDLENPALACLGQNIGVFNQREGDVVANIHRVEQRALLEEESDLPPDRGKISLAGRVYAGVFKPDFTSVGFEQTHDVFEHDRLAASAWPEDDRRPTPVECQVHLAQHLKLSERPTKANQSDDRVRTVALVAIHAHGRAPMILAMDASVHVKSLHRGRLIRVEVLSWIDQQGRSIAREVVRHPGAVVIVPLSGPDRVVLVKNYRIAIDEHLWELPAGTLEPNELPLDAAKRELEEETGYRPVRIEPMGQFFTSPGFCNELIYVFVAQDLTFVGQRLEPHEQIEAHEFGWTDALAMIDDGRIKDGKTIAGLLMQQRRLEDATS